MRSMTTCRSQPSTKARSEGVKCVQIYQLRRAGRGQAGQYQALEIPTACPDLSERAFFLTVPSSAMSALGQKQTSGRA